MSDPISSYIADVQRNLQAGIAREHTYRPALKTLVEALATGVTAFNDPKRVDCGALDFTVARDTKHGPLTIGYIEAKDIDTDLQAIERDAARKSPTTRDGEQLKRYLTLPNLILTDYLEFRWYVDGQPRMPPVRLARPIQAGKLQKEPGGPEAVVQLIRAFLDHKPPPVSKPRDLALRMARLTHLIRDMLIAAFDTGHASGMLHDLHRAFEETLVPDLKVPDFADMYAQTLAYGLFAARVNHEEGRGRFRRLGAAAEIPKTNPFLRKLFDAITGTALDDEPYVGLVDDLAQLLADTDIPALLADFGKRGVGQDPALHFYQTFLAEYAPQIQEQRGVYYTPEPVVSYIVRSVDYLLKTRFRCPQGLADESTVTYTRRGDGEERQEPCHRVLILDPACGTGTFLYTVVDLIREQFIRQGNAGMWPGYVRQHLLPRLFGFELMMAPYAVAHLKLAMQLAAQDMPPEQRPNWGCDLTDERLAIYLTNTLEQAIARSDLLMAPFITDEANAAVRVKRDLPIMVVLGNPPYSGHSANRSETIVEVQRIRLVKGKQVPIKRGRLPATVKRKVKTFIGQLIEDYKLVDGAPLGEKNPKWLQDDYVKFIRFGQWRIQQTGAGVLAFITNHGYLDNPTFRGMRQQLMQAFTDIYVLDLHGNSKKKEVCPDGSPDKNVFDIQQGVAISIFVREPGKSGPATVHHAELWGLQQPKYNTLFETDLASTQWAELTPESPFYLFLPQRTELRAGYDRGWKLPDAFPVNSVGIVTSRDGFVFDFDPEALRARIADFLDPKNSDDAVRQRYLSKGDKLNVGEARKKLRADKRLGRAFTSCLYRPFDVRRLLYHDALIERARREVMRHMLSGENLGLVTARSNKSPDPDHFFCSRLPMEAKCGESTTQSYLLPLYVYPSHHEVASGLYRANERRPNLNPAFIADIENRLGLTFAPDGTGDLQNTFGPEDVFHYIYAVLHSPTYRTRYADFLKIDFPHIPLTSDLGLFRALCAKGKELAALHLMESPILDTAPAQHPYPVSGDHTIEKGHPRYLAPGQPDPATAKPLAAGRVYISRDVPKTGKKGQYFDGVPPEVWDFHVGGYQVCEKWLKDRRGRTLSYDDLAHYQKIVVALKDTIRLMAEIDRAIPSWPLP